MFEHTRKSGNREILSGEEFQYEVEFAVHYISRNPSYPTEKKIENKMKCNRIFFSWKALKTRKWKINIHLFFLFLYILLVDKFACVDRKRTGKKE